MIEIELDNLNLPRSRDLSNRGPAIGEPVEWRSMVCGCTDQKRP